MGFLSPTSPYRALPGPPGPAWALPNPPGSSEALRRTRAYRRDMLAELWLTLAVWIQGPPLLLVFYSVVLVIATFFLPHRVACSTDRPVARGPRDAERALQRWERLVHRARRLKRLRRLWNVLGAYLREIKHR